MTVKLTDQKMKDLSILMSKVYSRKYGKEVTVEYRKERKHDTA